MRLAYPMLQDFVYLANRMRPDEIAHFLAMSGLSMYEPDVAARAMAATPGPAFVLLDDDSLPIVAGGFEPQRPGVYAGWQAGTVEGWERHWQAITLNTNRMIRNLLRGDAHRVQVTTLASRTNALAWYERGLKMTCEGLLKGYAADGQDAVIYARTAP